MGCRPSRASLGRVGDSSWEYNKNFIKEQKEKKPKHRKTGRGGRRKAPVYNDFSSTSKTYTNLHSKSSRITVRLSTDGSTLEIEQYDIDLNACVDRYHGQVTSPSTHTEVRSSYQTRTAIPGRQPWMYRCYSAPQLSIVADSPDGSRCIHVKNNGATKQHSKSSKSSKPKKSKSDSEKGFSKETNAWRWCDRTLIDDVTPDVRHSSKRDRHEVTHAIVNSTQMASCNNTFCDYDIKVLDIESEQCLSESDRLSDSNKNKRPKLLLDDGDSNGSCNGYVLERSCCGTSGGAACANRNQCRYSECDRSGAIERCECSKRLCSNIDSCRGNTQRTCHSEISPTAIDPVVHTNLVEECGNGNLCYAKHKSMECAVTQHTAAENIQIGDRVPGNGKSCLSHISQTVSNCQGGHTGYAERPDVLSPVGHIRTPTGSVRTQNLISDIDFSRRSIILPSQLTNGFKNGDVCSVSVLRCLDPKSIQSADSSGLSPVTNTETPSANINGPPRSNIFVEQGQRDNTIACTPNPNVRKDTISKETAEKLLEGSNNGSGMSAADLVVLVQTNSSPGCRSKETESDFHPNEIIYNQGVEAIRPLIGYGAGKYVTSGREIEHSAGNYVTSSNERERNAGKYVTSGNERERSACKYVTSGEETDETNSPDFEESLDESFEKRFDFSNCRYGVLIDRDGGGTVNVPYDSGDTSGSDIDDEEFLDALESTYV